APRLDRRDGLPARPAEGEGGRRLLPPLPAGRLDGRPRLLPRPLRALEREPDRSDLPVALARRLRRHERRLGKALRRGLPFAADALARRFPAALRPQLRVRAPALRRGGRVPRGDPRGVLAAP